MLMQVGAVATDSILLQMQAGAAAADSSLLQMFEEKDLRSTTCSFVLVSLMYFIKLHVA